MHSPELRFMLLIIYVISKQYTTVTVRPYILPQVSQETNKLLVSIFSHTGVSEIILCEWKTGLQK